MVGAHLGDRKMARQIDVNVEPVAWRTDEASVTRGRYLFASRGCTDCHGGNGAGKDVINDGKGMHVRAEHHARRGGRRRLLARPTGTAPSATASSATAARCS